MTSPGRTRARTAAVTSSARRPACQSPTDTVHSTITSPASAATRAVVPVTRPKGGRKNATRGGSATPAPAIRTWASIPTREDAGEQFSPARPGLRDFRPSDSVPRVYAAGERAEDAVVLAPPEPLTLEALGRIAAGAAVVLGDGVRSRPEASHAQ